MGEEEAFPSLQPNQVGVPILFGGLRSHQVSGSGTQKLERLDRAPEHHASMVWAGRDSGCSWQPLPRVLAQQSSESLPTDHRSGPQHRIRAGDRRLQAEGSVGTRPVVVLEPLGQDALEVAPVEDQYPVQALTPSRTDLPLHVSVCLGRRDRRLDHFDAFGLEHQIGAAAVLGVVIVDQEPGVDSDLSELPAQVSRLLTHPARVRPIGDREPDHPPGGQLHI